MAHPNSFKHPPARRREALRSFFQTLFIFISAFVLRVAFLPTSGWMGDIKEFKTWMWQVMEGGVAAAYSPLMLAPHQVPPPGPVYQPVFLYLLKGVGLLYRNLFGFPFGSGLSSDLDAVLLTLLIKFPGILFDMGIGLAIYFFLRRMGKKEMGLWAAFLYCFNPYLFLDTAHWGLMADPVYTFFVIVSFMMLSMKRIRLAGVFMALGILTKPQAFGYIPLLVFATLRKFGWKGIFYEMFGGGVCIFWVCFPFILKGTLGEVVFSMTNAIGLQPFFHIQAFNIWYLFSLGQLVSDATPILGVLTFQHLGLILYSLAYLWVLLPIRKDWDWRDLFPRVAFIAFSFFMLCTEMHDNYIFPTVALLALAAVVSTPFRTFYLAISLSAFLMLCLRDPFIRSFLTEWLPGRRAFILVPSLILCLINTLLLLSWVGLSRRTLGSESGALKTHEDPRKWLGIFGILTGCLGFIVTFSLLVFRPFFLSWAKNFLVQATPYPREGLNYLILGISERPFAFYWKHVQSLMQWVPSGILLIAIIFLLMGGLLWKHAKSHPLTLSPLEDTILTKARRTLMFLTSSSVFVSSLGLLAVFGFAWTFR